MLGNNLLVDDLVQVSIYQKSKVSMDYDGGSEATGQN
jgi:hypothetical protein